MTSTRRGGGGGMGMGRRGLKIRHVSADSIDFKRRIYRSLLQAGALNWSFMTLKRMMFFQLLGRHVEFSTVLQKL